VSWVQFTNAVYFFEVKGPHLDHDIELLVLILSICVWVLASEGTMVATWLLVDLGGISHTDLSVKVHFTVNGGSNQIKEWDNITGEVL
jgi:hypothetical protein